MSSIKPDIEIARAAKIHPIKNVLAKLNVPDGPETFMPIGRYIAKINLEYIHKLKEKNSNLILVTAITPTPAGEGKTTTSVGLSDGLNKIGKKSIVCLREPSLGPSFGMKGGAAGGGYAQVIPMEKINLHFTGDFHAITSAHNLLSALIDNHIYWGNKLNIDVRRIVWRRVVDLNDRALRSININLGGVANGFPREDGFDITVASEIMAIFCLSNNLKDLEEKLLIDEVVIKNEYQAYLDSFDSTIRRSASHLMLNISEERNEEEALLLAGEIKKKLENGNDFQKLVQEFSDDEGTKNSGGSLGVSDGNAFPEEFEIALEDMEEGQVSNPIFLETSIHLLKLTNIQTPIPEEYELKKGGIKQSLVEEAANLEYIDSIELAAELTYTSDNLEALAKELNMQIKTKNFFSKGEAEGLFKERSLLNSIFDDPSVKKGSMSELIEINNQYGIVFELEGFQEKKTKDFQSVKEEAKSLLTNNLIREKMNLLERSMVGKMDGGSSLEEVSKENELKVESYKSVSRDSSLFTQNALVEIFNEPKSNIGRSYSSVSLTNGDTLIFRLDKVTYLNNEVADDQKDSLESFFLEERSESELVDLQISMQDSASVLIN